MKEPIVVPSVPEECLITVDFILQTSRASVFGRQYEMEYGDQWLIRPVYMKCTELGLDPDRAVAAADKFGWSYVYRSVVDNSTMPET